MTRLLQEKEIMSFRAIYGRGVENNTFRDSTYRKHMAAWAMMPCNWRLRWKRSAMGVMMPAYL